MKEKRVREPTPKKDSKNKFELKAKEIPAKQPKKDA